MKNYVTRQKPTESELEILTILWDYGPSTVRFVNNTLNKNRKVGYTTTLKIMQIMTDKGFVTRNEEGRTHVYTARLKREKVQNQMLDKLLHSAFDGSAKKLVLQTLGNYQATNEELREIKELIKKIEGGQS